MPLVTKAIGLMGLATAVLLPMVGCSGISYNQTASVPKGLYWPSDGALDRGSFVTFCPPAREPFQTALHRRYLEPGNCAIGSYPMIKRIEGVAGDHYAIGSSGVRINGRLIPDSAPAVRDALGRAMPSLSASGIIPEGQMLVMGINSPASFDSRYFGLLPAKGTKRMKPALLWGSDGHE